MKAVFSRRLLRRPEVRHLATGLIAASLLLSVFLPPSPPPGIKAATQPQISNAGYTTTNASTNNRTIASFSHTVPAGNQRLLVVILHMEGTRTVSSVTYAGYALTLARREDSGSTLRCQVQIWYMVAPPVGTANVVVTYGQTQDWDAVTVLNYVGVHQSAPVVTTAGRTLQQNSFFQTVPITTSVENSMVIGGVTTPGSSGDPFTPWTDVTERADYDTGGGGGAGSDGSCFAGEANRATPGTFTFGATSSASLRGTVACVEFRPADPDIANVGGEYDFGVVEPASSYVTGLTRFAVWNLSGFSVYIYISGTDLQSGDPNYYWKLSNDGNPTSEDYALRAGLFGGSYNIVVRKDPPFNRLCELKPGLSQQWGLMLLTPTGEFTDSNTRKGVVTLTAAAV